MPDPLLSATRLEVRLANGGTYLCTVKLLSVRGVLSYAEMARNPAALAELFTGEKAGWADSLTIESVFEVVEAGVRLNQPNFLSFRAGGDRIALAAQDLEKAAERSGGGSPTSSSSPG